MEADELKGRLAEMQTLVDEGKSEPPALKLSDSAFGLNELGQELRPFQAKGAPCLLNGKQGGVLAMI